MNRFLASIEKKAYNMALIATGHREDALDIVQDAMLTLVRRYGDRPRDEWKPLFYRILNNRIMDHYRRSKVRRIMGGWRDWFRHHDEEDGPEPGPDVVAGPSPDPARQLESEQALDRLAEVIRELPPRQQQAFLLRTLEGMDVRETAAAMGCSEGSVKTHLSRAMQHLNTRMEGWL